MTLKDGNVYVEWGKAKTRLRKNHRGWNKMVCERCGKVRSFNNKNRKEDLCK